MVKNFSAPELVTSEFLRRPIKSKTKIMSPERRSLAVSSVGKCQSPSKVMACSSSLDSLGCLGFRFFRKQDALVAGGLKSSYGNDLPDDDMYPLAPAVVQKSDQVLLLQKVKIGIYFAIWWSLNVVFNIYNKKVLNVFPYPWLTSLLSLAAGSLIMLSSWTTRIVKPPKTDPDFWKALAPVSQ